MGKVGRQFCPSLVTLVQYLSRKVTLPAAVVITLLLRLCFFWGVGGFSCRIEREHEASGTKQLVLGAHPDR